MLGVALVLGLLNEGDPVRMQTIPTLLFVLVWYAWPRAIRFTADAIVQRDHFGRVKKLAYKDIDGAEFSPSDGSTVVVGPSAVIKHSRVHSDSGFFQALLEERTGREFFDL